MKRSYITLAAVPCAVLAVACLSSGPAAAHDRLVAATRPAAAAPSWGQARMFVVSQR